MRRSASLLNAQIDPNGALEIAKRSRGTPRIANRLLRRVRDFAEVKADGHITAAVADAALAMLDVDPVGFDLMDRKLLEAILYKFDGGPVGIDNLAAAIGEERDTIEDVLEPYLIQQGFLQRTPRGRVATLLTYRHFGLSVPDTGRTERGEWDTPTGSNPSPEPPHDDAAAPAPPHPHRAALGRADPQAARGRRHAPDRGWRRPVTRLFTAGRPGCSVPRPSAGVCMPTSRR